VVLSREFSANRDAILSRLKESGIEARPVFFPLHRMPPYAKYCQSDSAFPMSDWLSECGISLPSSTTLTEEEINRTCECLKNAISMAIKYVS
jgi:perosamine synthetase